MYSNVPGILLASCCVKILSVRSSQEWHTDKTMHYEMNVPMIIRAGGNMTSCTFHTGPEAAN